MDILCTTTVFYDISETYKYNYKDDNHQTLLSSGERNSVDAKIVYYIIL